MKRAYLPIVLILWGIQGLSAANPDAMEVRVVRQNNNKIQIVLPRGVKVDPGVYTMTKGPTTSAVQVLDEGKDNFLGFTLDGSMLQQTVDPSPTATEMDNF